MSRRTLSPTFDKLFVIDVPHHSDAHTEGPNSFKRLEWLGDEAGITTTATVTDIRERFGQILNEIQNKDHNQEKSLDDIYDFICLHPQSMTLLQCIYDSRKVIIEDVIVPCLKRYSKANTSGNMVALKTVKDCHDIIQLLCSLLSKRNISSFPSHKCLLNLLWSTLHRLSCKDKLAQIETIKLILLSIASVNAAKWLIITRERVDYGYSEKFYIALIRMILQKLVSDICIDEKKVKYDKYKQLSTVYQEFIQSRGIFRTADDIMLQQTTFRAKNNAKRLKMSHTINNRLIRQNNNDNDSNKKYRESTSRIEKSKEVYFWIKPNIPVSSKETARNISSIHLKWQTSPKYKIQDRFWEFLGFPVDE